MATQEERATRRPAHKQDGDEESKPQIKGSWGDTEKRSTSREYTPQENRDKGITKRKKDKGGIKTNLEDEE